MATMGTVLVKKQGRSRYVLDLKNVSNDGKKYISSNISKMVDRNVILGAQNLMLRDNDHVFYDASDFKDIINVKQTGTSISVCFNRQNIRKASKKYLRGDLDSETGFLSDSPEFDYTKNFFKNNIFSIEEWFKKEDKTLKSKYSIDVIIR